MAFNRDNFARQTDAMNTGGVTVDSVIYNAPAVFSYRSAGDAQAAIAAANYFADAVYDFAVGDLIFAIDSSSAYKSYRVSAVDRSAGTIATVVIAW